ncbi:hypothetical protein COLO4_07271 [Corchorus olitorius]|uniref:Uncharacterized protein n=1 Tax=Corchorus olitorius TaxID=93759 RepID=A0A1R3KKA5_9ROSI|nr:hypothetical protein COLO4_07271 [Corchorus olitorius]
MIGASKQCLFFQGNKLLTSPFVLHRTTGFIESFLFPKDYSLLLLMRIDFAPWEWQPRRRAAWFRPELCCRDCLLRWLLPRPPLLRPFDFCLLLALAVAG